MSLKNSKRFAIGAIFAASVGYLMGILTAPKSGKETRKEIADTTLESKREIEKKLKKVHSELKINIKTAQTELDAATTQINKELDKAINKAKKAEIKVKETLSALHEGTADNPELSVALTEANEALRHFKKYLASK